MHRVGVRVSRGYPNFKLLHTALYTVACTAVLRSYSCTEFTDTGVAQLLHFTRHFIYNFSPFSLSTRCARVELFGAYAIYIAICIL